jgi:hypothetical protein
MSTAVTGILFVLLLLIWKKRDPTHKHALAGT